MNTGQHYWAFSVSPYVLNSPSPLRGEGWGEGLSFEPYAVEKPGLSNCEIWDERRPGETR